MDSVSTLLFFLVAFGLIVLASNQIGEFFTRYKLPLISGFLFTGIIAGPFILNLIPEEEVVALHFIDEMALAFIAFAAGGELNLEFVRGNLKQIVAIITGQTVVVIAFGITAFILLTNAIPFMQNLSQPEIWAVGILGATIMVARSPSSALAIIKEMRAKGPFIQKVLGATVLKDAVVILIFTISVSLASVLIEGGGFNFIGLGFIIFDIFLDILVGILIGILLRGILFLRARNLQYFLVLLCGYGVFFIADQLRDVDISTLPLRIFSEPLLICMVSGFYVANFTRYGMDFHKTIGEMSPIVFLAFFTLVGAELELDILRTAWLVAVILVLVRLAGIFLGSFIGGTVSGDPLRQNAILGMTFITQAGVSIGLAKEIGVEFSTWGNELATLSIGVIVINQIIGPPLFKWAVNLVGEAHPRAEETPFDGVRDALIFGMESQSFALAHQLKAHDWQVKIVTRRVPSNHFPESVTDSSPKKVEIITVPDLSLDSLGHLEMPKVDTVVLLLSDEENYNLCELIYENYGIRQVVVRLNDHSYQERFAELGALIVNPTTAVVSLMDQLVRSPVAASLLLGTEDGQELVDMKVRTAALNGIALRDLRLPLNSLILSVHRDGHTLISHGYTRLKEGDELTILGTRDSLEELSLLFEY